jgi:hypothetical protein
MELGIIILHDEKLKNNVHDEKLPDDDEDSFLKELDLYVSKEDKKSDVAEEEILYAISDQEEDMIVVEEKVNKKGKIVVLELKVDLFYLFTVVDDEESRNIQDWLKSKPLNNTQTYENIIIDFQNSFTQLNVKHFLSHVHFENERLKLLDDFVVKIHPARETFPNFNNHFAQFILNLSKYLLCNVIH